MNWLSNYRGPISALNGDPDGKTGPCPQCKGRCFTDEYEEIECDVCLGEGEIPLI